MKPVGGGPGLRISHLQPRAAGVPQFGQKTPVGVELAGDAEPRHLGFGRDGVDMHLLEGVRLDLIRLDQVKTKLIARISRISEELKLISLMRFRTSAAVCGISGRSSGLMWTMTTSWLVQL